MPSPKRCKSGLTVYSSIGKKQGQKTQGGSMKFVITLFQDEDGVFIAECPSIPGCVSQGKSESEAEANIREAIKECLEVRAEKGMPLTVSTRQVEVAV
jgi:predicted RNase H-like HicB family nuclease